MPVRQADFLVVCAVAAIGLTISLALSLATATSSGSADASVQAPQNDPPQVMMNSKDLPAAHYDDYSVAFN